MLQTLLYIGIAFAAVVILVFYLSSKFFYKKIISEIEFLKSLSSNISKNPLTLDNLGSLPLPLRSYIKYALPEASTNINYAYMQHSGLYRTKPSHNWFPIEGEEHFTAQSPNFIWFAELNIKDILKIKVREKYLNNLGNIWVRLYSLITLVNSKGKESDQSAFIRYISEMVFFPTSFLTNHYISWEEIDSGSFKALIKGNTITEVIFHINEFGQIIKATTKDRYRNKTKNDWTILYDEYMDINGFKVPTYSEAIWNSNNNKYSYSKFYVTKLVYNNY